MVQDGHKSKVQFVYPAVYILDLGHLFESVTEITRQAFFERCEVNIFVFLVHLLSESGVKYLDLSLAGLEFWIVH